MAGCCHGGLRYDTTSDRTKTIQTSQSRSTQWPLCYTPHYAITTPALHTTLLPIYHAVPISELHDTCHSLATYDKLSGQHVPSRTSQHLLANRYVIKDVWKCPNIRYRPYCKCKCKCKCNRGTFIKQKKKHFFPITNKPTVTSPSNTTVFSTLHSVCCMFRPLRPTISLQYNN